MRTPLLLLISLSLLLNISAHAEIYKTKDKQGRVVYTDQPAASDTKAKIVDLPSINQLPVAPPIASEDPRPTEPDTSYTIEIISPASGTRLLADQRNLTLAISPNQSLAPGLFFAYFLNGNKVAETRDLTFTISEPPRGENTLHVAAMDQDGKIFGESPAITVYVMRPIVKRNPL